MVRGKLLKQGDDLTDALYIRNEVFVKEQHCSAENEFDEWDPKAIHAVAYDGEGKPVATGRLLLDDNLDFYIGRVAVLKEYRHQKYGDFIVRLLVDQAFQCAASVIYIHAQMTAVPFYEKLGFVAEGDVFLEENIEHIKMSLKRGAMKTACGHCVG